MKLARFVKIRWEGFAHTAHWLQGVALIDYLVREMLLPEMRAQLSAPDPLLKRLGLLEDGV